MEDSRFSQIKIDPKFRRISKKQRKVKIDKRFQSMFNDKKFKVKYTTDIRGRPVNQTSNEDLKRYYELSSDESEESNSESEGGESEEKQQIKNSGKSSKELNGSELIEHKSDGIVTDPIKQKLRNLDIDYARGESKLLSESSSDDEDSEDSASETEELDHKWGELDNDAGVTDEATSRLAACNMDWDRIRAVDLMVLFCSFLGSGSFIKSVAIYPSEFGKARMKEEELKGPMELVETKSEYKDENEDENEDGSSYHMEKLRQYQLNRLKYYYAVISFDNTNSANKVYTECDGMEYESSSIKIDLRFIPEDMEFEDEPKEICEKLPEVNKYQPRFFTTTALQQAKVDLTWDETNPDRIELAQKLSSGKIDDISKSDLQNYLATSSEESGNEDEKAPEISGEENEEDTIDKYKALLQEIEGNEKSKKNKEVEMEITWGIDLEEKTEKLVKDKVNKDKTPFEKYLDKRKEKRKEKRNLKKTQKNGDSDSDIPSDIDMNDPYFAEEFNNSEFKKTSKKTKSKEKEVAKEESEQNDAELELLLMNEENNQKHFSLKKILDNENESKNKKKRKNKKVIGDNKPLDDFQVDVEDERFSALFTSHHYNVDPTNPHYKKTKAMETLEQEKQKRRIEEKDEQEPRNISKKSKKNTELSRLVNSVKRKTNEYMSK